MYDPYNEFTRNVLPNGLEVHSVFWDRPWIRIEIVIHSGAREDLVAMPGLAHFVEHAVRKNIPNREFNQAKEFFEACGGETGFGTTNYLSTQYGFAIPANPATFRAALSIFGSMLLGARLEKEIELERMVIHREFNRRYSHLEKLEWDMGIRKALFKGHRLETYNRPLGRPEGFLSITQDDLRRFYDKHYVPANISLVIVGGVQIKEVLAELEKSPFGIQKNGVRNPISPPFNKLPTVLEHSKIVKLSDHTSFTFNQTGYKATWTFPAGFPRQAHRVFNQVLDNILWDEIREKRGLAYSINTASSDYQDVLEYEIVGQIAPTATSNIDELIRKCIWMIPSRRDLFDRKLRSTIQRCSMLDLSGLDLADNAADDLLRHHRIISMQEVRDALKKVTHEQMEEAATFLSSDRQYTFITRP